VSQWGRPAASHINKKATRVAHSSHEMHSLGHDVMASSMHSSSPPLWENDMCLFRFFIHLENIRAELCATATAYATFLVKNHSARHLSLLSLVHLGKVLFLDNQLLPVEAFFPSLG